MSGRRVSQPTSTPDPVLAPTRQDSSVNNKPESEEMIAELTRKLDTLRRQKEEVETQLSEEIKDSDKQRASLTAERDTVKRVVEEKEKASMDLRKQVNEFEKQFKAAQRRRQAREKTLQQKKAERQKMREDIEKWIEHSLEMQEKTESLKSQKLELEEAHAKKIEQARETIESTLAESKVLEEEIQIWGIKVRDLENDRKKADEVQNEEEEEADRREKEEEVLHEAKIQDMQNQYAILWKLNTDVGPTLLDTFHRLTMSQMETQCSHEQEYLNQLLELKSREPGRFGTASGLDLPSTYMQQRRNRQASNRLSSSTYGSNTQSTSPAFNGTPNLYNPLQSAAFSAFGPPSRTGTGFSGMSHGDVDLLTAGAPMSPTANNLLPSDLLGDDDLPRSPMGSGGRPPLDTIGYRSSSFDPTNPDPSSPLSMHSASPSLLSSPHESFANISMFPSDADRQSLHSTGSPYNQSIVATSGPGNDRRRGSFFNFSRQRAPKSSLTDLPPLGSLKANQSQSFPSNDQEAAGASSGRKKLGSSVWSSPMANFLNRGSSTALEAETGSTPVSRKPRRGLFGSKLDPVEALAPLDRSTSPRPPSTYSYENGLPRPSSDSQPFGWPTQDALRQRSSPLGGNWSSIGLNRSGNPSRRQSIQHGSTSNLSIGSTPLNPDEISGTFGPLKPPQPAPIGTERFTISRDKSKVKPVKQLNPAAPSFKTRIFPKKAPKSDADSEPSSKSRSKDKDKHKEKDKDKVNTTSRSSDADLLSEDSLSHSHSSPRLSRDAYSIDNPSDSAPDFSFALEPTSSSAHSDLAPPSTSTPSSSAPKESLMQRITRKSSSSKFSAAWKERGASIFSSKKSAGEPSTPGDVDEEGDGGDYLGVKGPAGSEAGTPGGEKEEKEKSGRPSLSWSRVMSRKGKGVARVSSEVDRDKEKEEAED